MTLGTIGCGESQIAAVAATAGRRRNIPRKVLQRLVLVAFAHNDNDGLAPAKGRRRKGEVGGLQR